VKLVMTIELVKLFQYYLFDRAYAYLDNRKLKIRQDNSCQNDYSLGRRHTA
jgi:hypothetical protein